jgi:tetratricopeptide (TPR) repeat protein
MLKKLPHLLALATFTAATISSNAQALKVPAPSPLQTIKQSFALSDIIIEYSRPSVKGRTVFGDVVPYGKMWRTGANQSTKVAFGEDVKVEGVAIPTGTYALYTIPNKDSWEVMLYKDLALSGNTADYKKENEVARFNVKPVQINDQVETMTFNVANITAKTADIQLSWDKTRISLNVVADIDNKIMKNIETALSKDSRPYYQAATYYYDNGKDLAKASEWVDKAIENNPKAFYMYLMKAKIKARQGDKKAATAAAQQVIPLAKEAKNDEYVKMAEKFLADNK